VSRIVQRVYKYFRDSGHLFPYDVRYDPDDIAHSERLADGSIRFRVITEPGFTEVVVARTDGVGTPMRRYAASPRFEYWEAIVRPDGPVFEYSIALRHGADRIVYLVPAGITNAAERLDYWSLDVAEARSLDVPSWAAGAAIYQIFPDRFADGDPSLTPPNADPWGSPPNSRRFQGGDLRGVIDRADYLADLSIDAVYLNPIFTSLSVHRYDAIDYYQVDPRLGGNDVLAEMVEQLHARDIRVILDASFNHCHPHFFAFADVLAGGPSSEFWPWFDVFEYPPYVKVRPRVAGELYGDRADHFLEYHVSSAEAVGLRVIESDDDGPPIEPTYASWYGVPTMPRLMLSNPETRDYFLDVAVHWVKEYDIDGWRMDVARYVDHDFWPEFRRKVKAAKPDAYLIAEIMGDAMPWLQGNRFDATMNYQFRELALDFFAEGSIDGSRFVDGLNRMHARYAPAAMAASQNLLSSHDTQRFLTMAGEDPLKMALAVFTQMTVPGAPGLYYGDEVGMTGGEDPACRGAFPWHKLETWDQGLLMHTRSLTRLRREYPALRTGDFAVVWTGEEGFAFIRATGDERLLIAVNRGDAPLTFFAPITTDQAKVVWGKATLTVEPLDVRVEDIPPRSGLIAAV
jgi:glycosidase